MIPDTLCQPYPIPVVRALIGDAGGRILLLQRAAAAYGPGSWCLPGGKVDYGQTVAEALAREIREETSLQLLAAEFWFWQDSLPIQPGGMHYLNLYFLCRARGEVRLNAESYQAADAAGELLAAALCAEAVGNLALALELERELPAGKAPLLVYVNSRCGWSTLLPASGPALNNPRLRAFGMLEDVWTMETLRDENQDKLARAFHKIYSETQARRRREGEELALRPAEKPWEQLEEGYRAANRAVADHLPIKLQAVGWEMLPLSDPRAQADLDISELQKLILSRMEHARWCAERWMAGWTRNPQRDEAKKQHNLLIPWEQLPENERRLDKEMIDNIPKALQEIGYGVAPKVI